MELREKLQLGGLALLAASGLMILNNSSKASSSSTTPKPPPAPTKAPSLHQPVAQWIHDARARPRPDVVALIVSRAWVQLMARYLTEQWPEEVPQGGPMFGAWTEVEGQWLRVHQPGFWAAIATPQGWYSMPAPVLAPATATQPAIYGPTEAKVQEIGEFLKQQGAPDPAYGWAGAPL